MLGVSFQRAALLLSAVAFLPSLASAQAVDPYPRVNAAFTQARDLFGSSVAISGTTLVIGAPGDDEGAIDSGSVFVFERDYTSDQIWVETARLSAPSPAFGDRFGASVAIEDDVIVVGAPGRDVAGVQDSGEIFAFERLVGPTWSSAVSIVPPGAAVIGDSVGSVALSGSTLLVGAPLADRSGLVDSGRAWTFERIAPMIWSFDVEIMPDMSQPAAAGDQFGSVAVDGNRMVVGAWKRDVLAGPGTLVNAGAAYVFERIATFWFQAQYLTGVDGMGVIDARDEDGFGQAVAIEGSLMAIGARKYDLPGLFNGGNPVLESNSGAVFLFERSGPAWSFDERVDPPGVFQEEEFGNSVAIEDGMLAVGSAADNATNAGFPAIRDRGRVFLFQEDAISMDFEELVSIHAYDGLEGDFFGNRVALSGDLIAVGAVLDDSGQGLQFGGSCYVFEQEFTTPAAGNFRHYCLGDGANLFAGDGACTTCQCTSDSTRATWGGCKNSSSDSLHGGAGARLIASGVPTVGTDTLHFDLVHGVGSSFAVLTSGANRLPNNPMNNPCTSLSTGINALATLDGLRCVAGTNQRHGGRLTDPNGAAGLTNAGWGPPNNPMLGISTQGMFVAGQTRHFQIVQRDLPEVGCGNALITSQGVSITFLP